MKTINSDYDQQFHSPQFLHISQINKLISPLKHDRKQNLSPFTEPKKPKNHYQRLHSSTQKNYQEIYSPFSCELAFSAEKFISDAHKINNLQSKIIEKGFNLPDKKTLDPALRKKSFLLRKSRIFQGPPNKLIFLEKSDSKNNKNNLSHSSKGSFKIEENLNENVILQENTSEQSEIIWRYMNNNKRDTEEIQSIKKEWVQALTKEERGSKLYHKTMKVYGWHPKILSMQKLDNDMDKIYGAGMSRHLKPGEEASVIENIRKILEKCEISPEFFHFSISTTVKKILKKADLKSLENFPLCMKQTELHWKLMATRFRYSGNQLLKNKKFEKIFESTQCKHHFLNLNQDNNLLVLYLLKYSKKI